MERIDSFEGKLFYKIYMLCKKNQINEEQKGKLKDLVIQKDERIEIAMNQFLEDRNEFRLLENFHNYSGEDYSPKSVKNFSDDVSNGSHSKFKGKRPAKMLLPKKTFMINLRKYDVKNYIKEIQASLLVPRAFFQAVLDQVIIELLSPSMNDFHNRTGANVSDNILICFILTSFNIPQLSQRIKK